jgi:DNA-binding transcriptional LysR family regulator
MSELTNERLFLLVVESGSFQSAAKIIGADPSSISRKISSLENRLQVKLFERTTRSSVPTVQGEIYYRGLKQVIEEQDALESALCASSNTPMGTLRVSAPPDFGAKFIAPVLMEMTNRYDTLNVELILGSEYDDLKAMNIDVALRIGHLADSSLICRKIADVPRVLVASADYLLKHGYPTNAESLQHHQFIFYSKVRTLQTLTILGKTGPIEIKVSGKFIVNSLSAIKELVLQGQGLHLGPKWAFKHELINGSVVAVLADKIKESYPLHAIYISRNFVPAKVKTFIDTLQKKYSDYDFDIELLKP